LKHSLFVISALNEDISHQGINIIPFEGAESIFFRKCAPKDYEPISTGTLPALQFKPPPLVQRCWGRLA